MSGTSFIHVHANASIFTTSSFSSAVLKARDVQFCSAVHFRKMRGVSACPFYRPILLIFLFLLLFGLRMKGPCRLQVRFARLKTQAVLQ